MAHIAGKPRKFQTDIKYYSSLYEHKNLRFVRNNWVFYWRFLASLEDIGYRPRTIERYHEKLRTFLNWLGSKSLRKVRKEDVEQFLLWYKRERQHTAYTLRYFREALAVFFCFVMRYSRMKQNPATALRIRTHFPQPECMEVFSREEVLMITTKPLEGLGRLRREDFPTDHSYLNALYTLKMQHLMIKLLFSTGIRPCELVNAKEDDLDEEHLRLRIQNKGNQQYIVKERYIFLTNATLFELKGLLQRSQLVRNGLSAGRLFIHYFGGGQIAPNYPNNVIKYWAKRCGIARKVYAYMCRYTYCTLLVENGVDPYSLKKLMGHKQMATTLKHYLKLTHRELRREWKAYNPLNKEGNYDSGAGSINIPAAASKPGL